MFMGAGAILLIIGIWLRIQILEVRMQAEEDVKSRTLSAEGANRQVKRTTLLINLTLFLGALLVGLAILAIIVHADIVSDGPLR